MLCIDTVPGLSDIQARAKTADLQGFSDTVARPQVNMYKAAVCEKKKYRKTAVHLYLGPSADSKDCFPYKENEDINFAIKVLSKQSTKYRKNELLVHGVPNIRAVNPQGNMKKVSQFTKNYLLDFYFSRLTSSPKKGAC